MKQRREKALQNAKDRKLAKENFLVAIKADCKADRASNDTLSSVNMNNELINGSNINIVIGVENTDNTAIAAENTDNDATNEENIDNAAINADNTSNTATDGEKSDDVAMIDDNIDNGVMSDNNTDDAVSGDDNTENTETGKVSTIDAPSPLLYSRKTTDPSKVKTSKRHIPIMVKLSEPSIGNPPPDETATVMASSHEFDPTDVRVYEFFIQGAPNQKT